MDGGGKKTNSICKYVPGIMALTYIETEKYQKSVKYTIKSMKQKHGLNPYMDATEVILPICKCWQNIMPVTNTRNDK